ncbi:glycosyltransferase [Apilactobacillus sp. TMW 2.2459]|uniref:glycosyltransferase n=1 Tax=Apilactobacillus xinyiensis TaxID=2841032 RepID=UPI00200BC6BE|nr:glycosyltransferase family 2 protein [Apilactobacillus xinyiensis]MCL0312566.1 glycosyltransferase [Apilactobacillus xinyiensis]
MCYPILSAIYIIFGNIFYKYFYNDKITAFKYDNLQDYPFVTIVISAHNENDTIEETLDYLENRINYINYEIIMVDDGSNDDTLKIALEFQKKYSNLRIIHVEKNAGKAHALNVSLGFAKGELILSNDADTLPEADALVKYVQYFQGIKNRNVGGVTGNMDVLNRNNVISKSQIIEFTSIVSGIKRTQSATSDNMYAFSGANTMYRKDALIDVGGFRQNRATEDISIAWDMFYHSWQTKFAPDIVFKMIVPENMKNLYRQRKRWSQGGTEVLLSNFTRMFINPIVMFKNIPLFFDEIFSFSWTFLLVFTSIIMVFTNIYYLSTGQFDNLFWLWLCNMILVCIEFIMGILQLLVSLHYDQQGIKMRYFGFSPVYISFLWLVNPFALLVTFPKACNVVFYGHSSGTWKSPR